MNQNLHQSGKKLLRSLSKHADIIMSAYLSGAVDESKQKPSDIEKLIDIGVLWRPEAEAELRLRRVVRGLLEEGLRDERNRQIDANVGSALSSLRTLREHYVEAKTRHRFTEADAHLADLTELVYRLTESLRYSVRILWERIHKEFAYVSSIDAKIRENELAQSQVSDMLQQLEMFKFDELSKLAGSDRDLRRLLVVTLHTTFADVSQELSLVQAKLIELLGRFREFQGRTRLLKGFLLHMEQKPDYQAPNYAKFSQVPNLFNLSKAIIKPAAIDVNDSEHENELLQLVGRIKALQHINVDKKPERQAQQILVEDQEEISLNDNLIKKAVEDYFCQIIDTGKRLSALDYYQLEQFEFDQEVWLYQVIGGYQALSMEEKEYFEIEQLTVPHARYNGNEIIQDLVLWLS